PTPALVSFLLLRTTTCSTLFPYTTLFRSPCNVKAACRITQYLAQSRVFPAPGPDRHQPARLSHAGRGTVGRRDARRKTLGGAIEDRKSTRLNSSHVKISYAVFCLKKNIRS